MRILVIEDEVVILETLQDLLEIHGHTVLAASTGSQGIALANQQPDLIFCDVGLPDMDGYAVITELQQNPATRDIPFLFLTARADREDQRRGMALGADDYITKPFTERDLLDAITARLRRQQPLRERVAQLLDEHQRLTSADWSHELLTPLAGIFGALDLIEAEADTIKPADLRELLGLIRSSAERQQRLSRKLIVFYELDRLVAQRSKATLGECALEAIIPLAAEEAARTEQRTQDLQLDYVSGVILGLTPYLEIAVAELVGNACRFSAPGSPIIVEGQREGRTYVLAVADRGRGMTPEQIAQIGPFTQFDRRKQEQQGLGLGLTIARLVATLTGGELRFDPRTDGDGLRVCLRLPLVS